MASSAPAAETKKPASPPPAKAGKAGAASKATDQPAGGKQAAAAPSAGKAAKPVDGKSPATPSQQRFDRMAVRAKLAVSQPGDAAEQEADRVATQVARSPQPATQPSASGKNKPSIQRAPRASAVTPDKKEPSAAIPAAQSIKRAAAPSSRPEQPLHREAQPGGAGEVTVPASTAQRIEARRGSGEPLFAAVRTDMEAKFAHDFSQVRIHTDAEAARMCAETQARAFTVGDDIYFAPGEFVPGSEAGRQLLAHELTHVVQQDGGEKNMLHRAENDNAATEPQHVGKKITNLSLAVPTEYEADFKKKAAPVLVHHKNYERSAFKQAQRSIWQDAIPTAAIEKKLGQAASKAQANQDRYIFEVPSRFSPVSSDTPGASTLWLVGSLKECAARTLIPEWDREGKPHKSADRFSYDVDHKVDLQFGAKDEPKFTPRDDFNVIDNMRLLDANLNRNEKNRMLDAAMDKALQPLVKKENETQQDKKKKVSAGALRHNNTLVFNQIQTGKKLAKNANDYWQRDEIEKGEHINALMKAAPKQIFMRDVAFMEKMVDKDHWVILNSPTGGRKNSIDKKQKSNKDILKPFETEIEEIKGTDNLARFTVSVPPKAAKGAISGNKGGKASRVSIDIPRLDGSDKIGYFPRDKFSVWMGLKQKAAGKQSPSPLDKNGASPMQIDDWDIKEKHGLSVTGQILPTFPLIGESSIDFELNGDELTFSKTFSSGEISLPRPFNIDDCSLRVSAATSGKVAIDGQVDFSVDKLGQGYLRGVAQPDGLGAEGQFDFDSKHFDRASIKVWYLHDKFGADGEIGVDKPGKLRGIKSGNLKMTYSEGKFDADGFVLPELSIIERAAVQAHYSENEGLWLQGQTSLKPNALLHSGSIDLGVHQHGDDFKVAATGTAQPAIPGIDSSLTVSYDDGAFLAEFHGAFQRGMLSGNASVGVTNRSVGDDGLPTGAPAHGAPLIVYGSGAATVQIAPWLQGTAGVRFAPNGEVTVNGQIGLPGQVEIFPRKELNKHIFGINIDIPIVPGVFAQVGGGLNATAGIGPGVIDKLTLGIEYNPAQEDKTHVTGDGHVNVPADAGLRLAVHGGIGLGIPGVSVSGGLEVGGALGIAGAAEAGVHIDWTPAQGLQIDTFGKLSAHPSFTFDVSGYVDVEALFFTVYENRWRLAQFQYGSDMTFGVTFPIHYRQGEPFNLSLSDVEFQLPDVDPGRILSDLVEKIV